jgi:hypothetical protein
MTPGKQRGTAVKVPFSIPITFKLNWFKISHTPKVGLKWQQERWGHFEEA